MALQGASHEIVSPIALQWDTKHIIAPREFGCGWSLALRSASREGTLWDWSLLLSSPVGIRLYFVPLKGQNSDLGKKD